MGTPTLMLLSTPLIIDAVQHITAGGGVRTAAMQLCHSLTNADKALECMQTFLRRSMRNPVHRLDPLPTHTFRSGNETINLYVWFVSHGTYRD